jgi:hypothetical protein
MLYRAYLKVTSQTLDRRVGLCLEVRFELLRVSRDQLVQEGLAKDAKHGQQSCVAAECEENRLPRFHAGSCDA